LSIHPGKGSVQVDKTASNKP